MFDFLIEAFNRLISPITFLLDILHQMYVGLEHIFDFMTDGINYVVGISGWFLPFASIFSCLITALGITVVLKILGR